VQRVYISPETHQPSASSTNHRPKEDTPKSSKGGGLIGWQYLFALAPLVALRRRKLLGMKDSSF
jgi:hypothetical protein